MSAKTEKPGTKPVSDEKPHCAGTASTGAEIAEDSLDTVVGGISRRGPRMS